MKKNKVMDFFYNLAGSVFQTYLLGATVSFIGTGAYYRADIFSSLPNFKTNFPRLIAGSAIWPVSVPLIVFFEMFLKDVWK